MLRGKDQNFDIPERKKKPLDAKAQFIQQEMDDNLPPEQESSGSDIDVNDDNNREKLYDIYIEKLEDLRKLTNKLIRASRAKPKSSEQTHSSEKIHSRFISTMEEAYNKIQSLRKLESALEKETGNKNPRASLENIKILEKKADHLIVGYDKNRIYKIDTVKPIAEGGEGAIYSATRVEHDVHKNIYIKIPENEFVAKVMNVDTFLLKEFHLLTMMGFKTEAPVLAQLSLNKEDKSTNKVVLLIENLGMPLSSENLLKLNTAKPAAARLRMINQIIKILVKLHRLGIIHCDIKGKNIVVRNDNEVFIIDFGSVQFTNYKNNPLISPAGSPYHMPPETSKEFTHQIESDYYSLVPSIIGLLGGEKALNPRKDFEKILDKNLNLKTMQQILVQIDNYYNNPDSFDDATRKKLAKDLNICSLKLIADDKLNSQHVDFLHDQDHINTVIRDLEDHDKTKNLSYLCKVSRRLNVNFSQTMMFRRNEHNHHYNFEGICDKDVILQSVKPYITLFLTRMMHSVASHRPNDNEVEDFFIALETYYLLKENNADKQAIDTSRLKIAILSSVLTKINTGQTPPVLAKKELTTPDILNDQKTFAEIDDRYPAKAYQRHQQFEKLYAQLTNWYVSHQPASKSTKLSSIGTLRDYIFSNDNITQALIRIEQSGYLTSELSFDNVSMAIKKLIEILIRCDDRSQQLAQDIIAIKDEKLDFITVFNLAKRYETNLNPLEEKTPSLQPKKHAPPHLTVDTEMIRPGIAEILSSASESGSSSISSQESLPELPPEAKRKRQGVQRSVAFKLGSELMTPLEWTQSTHYRYQLLYKNIGDRRPPNQNRVLRAASTNTPLVTSGVRTLFSPTTPSTSTTPSTDSQQEIYRSGYTPKMGKPSDDSSS